MLSHELLINKGFKLNTYPQGKYYEYENKDNTIIEVVMGDDYFGDEENIVLQLKEDFSGKVLAVDCNNWVLSDKEFEDILEKLLIVEKEKLIW
jgi:hypothetical protein